MAEETKPEEKPKPEHVRLTRAEIREVLRCPICKKPGALLDDACRFCGSHQDDNGVWVVPEPVEKKPDPEVKRKSWYEEEL